MPRRLDGCLVEPAIHYFARGQDPKLSLHDTGYAVRKLGATFLDVSYEGKVNRPLFGYYAVCTVH